MPRLVVISNRIPLGSNPSGGLVVGLRATMEEKGGLWVGISRAEEAGGPDGASDRLSGPDRGFQDHPGLRFARKSLEIPGQLYDDYYLGYANSVLWPLCHGRPDLLDLRPSYRNAYIDVNRRLAAALAPLLRPDDVIWVHDYHLFPLADALRREGIYNPVGFFLHIPFPSAANINALTHVVSLANWLAAYDLVGVQTRRDVASCLEVFRTLPGSELLSDGSIRFGARSVEVKSFPIGIDASSFVAAASGSKPARISPRPDAKVIIGADRLDYSKGLPHRFRAVGHLLEKQADLRRTVNYLQIASPTREDVQAYRDIREELEQLAGAINGKFADIGHTPIQYINRAVDRDRLAGLFRAARVGLVTPLADGMNLVAKEFVAAQDPGDPGVLVLSGFAGAAEQLGRHALIANPYDTQQMADCIAQALAMPLEERRQRHAAMLENVMTEDVNWWADCFVTALERKALDTDFRQLLSRLHAGQTSPGPLALS